ncbi:hypothetical protein Ciccas_012560 [Cichlidogyrus casuarinus]|uniref:Uncharacterized protein n=1 Tax=Cichlidogyrus casuarinus TaxID=1844966 RepID=A0ABD2PPU4_9PLAT
MYTGVEDKKRDLKVILENGEYMEKTLVNALLHNYDSNVRPVVDNSTPKAKGTSIPQITTEFGLSLIGILQLKEMDQKWTDYHLTWEPEEFDNLQELNIPPERIWLPDIHLYNYADERLVEIRSTDARVKHTGEIEWFPRAIYKSTCSVQIKHFPFDRQNCSWKFGPWSHDGYRLNITYFEQLPSLDMQFYQENAEWKVVEHKGAFTESRYPCCIEPFPDISFYIILERKSTWNVIILIVPCLLLSMLTLVLFWLPPETPAKMVLGELLLLVLRKLSLLQPSQIKHKFLT